MRCTDFFLSRCMILRAARAFTANELRDLTVGDLGELDKRRTSLVALETLVPADFMLFLEPPSIDDRIANQYAVFSVMSRSTLAPEDWLAEDPALSRKLIIPARSWIAA
jgi:hypothetical protein